MFLAQKTQKPTVPVTQEDKSFISIPRRESVYARIATRSQFGSAQPVAFAAVTQHSPSPACSRRRRPLKVEGAHDRDNRAVDAPHLQASAFFGMSLAFTRTASNV